MVTFKQCEWGQKTRVIFSGGGLYELDSARVAYSGRADKKEAFMASFIRGHALPALTDSLTGVSSPAEPRMFCLGFEDDGEANLPTITFSYTGVKTGRNGLPAPMGEDSQVPKPITVEGPISFSGSYYTPRTKWTWYEDTRPSSLFAKHSDVRGTLNPADTLFNLTGAEIAVARTYLAALKLRTLQTDYMVTDVVPDKLWRCSCTADKDFVRT